MSIGLSPVKQRVKAGKVARFIAIAENGLFCELTARDVSVCVEPGHRVDDDLRFPSQCAFLGEIELLGSKEAPFEVKARKRARGRYRIDFVYSYVTDRGRTEGDVLAPLTLRVKKARKR